MCSSVNHTSTFSLLDIEIESIRDRDDFGLFLAANELFDLDNIDEVEHEKAFRFIEEASTMRWPPSPFPNTEKEVFITICKKIFQSLTTDVVVDKNSYSKAKEVKTGLIGMGRFDTWHGSPDGRVRGAVVIYGSAALDESEGNTSSVEAKKNIVESNVDQLVGTTVTTSFVESNLHPTKPHFAVPTILIDLNKFRVCIYDCKHDILLISQDIPLSCQGKLDPSSLFALWVVINYR